MITREEAQARWRGVLIPLITPFKEDGGLDLSALRHNVQWILDQGARLGNSIFLAAGSGGDFSVMSVDERKKVITAVAEVVGDQAPVIAGAQSCDIRDCIAIAQLCADLGVDAIQISGPFYYDIRTDDLVAWIETIASEADVGFAIYNHWYSGTKYDMPLDVLERLLEVQNSVGIKWASPDLKKFYEGLRRFLPHVAVVNNTFLAVEAHMRGARTFVSHVPNYHPQFCFKVWELLEAQSYVEAREIYDAFMIPYGSVRGRISEKTAGEGVFVRPFMKLAGLDGGHSRLPSRDEAVTPDIMEDIEKLMVQLDEATA
jgi:4-hydroxy-tetrahydrodipicolinate synthase